MSKQVKFIPMGDPSAQSIIDGYKKRFTSVIVEQIDDMHKITYEDNSTAMNENKLFS